MKVVTINTIIGQINMRLADSFLSRLQGLLFSKKLAKCEGILIDPCSSVHTFGMNYSINVLFLSHTNEVLEVKTNLVPNRICVGPRFSKKVVELSIELELVPSDIIGKVFMEDKL